MLLAHSAVADVAAVGVPSLEWGEAVGVAVAVRAGHAQPDEVVLEREAGC